MDNFLYSSILLDLDHQHFLDVNIFRMFVLGELEGEMFKDSK
jgi:hypothetical protein